MRVAVVADIHGNVAALEAVIADIRRQAPDLVLNLGDCVSGPLQPRATADLLMDLNWPTIRGNHDREVAETPPANLGQSDRIAAEEIGEHHHAWLRSLPATLTAAGDLFLCHGTPASDMAYLTERVADAGSVHPVRTSDLAAETATAPGNVVLCGHTHIARLYRLPDAKIIANPGSVGLPGYSWDVPTAHTIEAGSPHARYLIMDRAGGTWHFTFRAVAYDWDKAAASAMRHGREDWARPLATGYTA
jgi:predicted phosphodiesterase